MDASWTDFARLLLLLALPLAAALLSQRATGSDAAKRFRRRAFRWTWLPGRRASRSRS